ncbi:hypothetical protein A0H81_00697 [Grifola frondosa]|uniref:Uncharacterized protein n=1 Tax=Grifola frondosa TaxID=5627 RepID=A0A1C7MSA9_GRIFR|nr:hypothetical protein A0H81_00697 [Grifola frondosa]
MPVLKDWFGDWTEQIANKKDAEISNTPANSRDRRFRRDPEDGDASTRPTFRTIVTQPSQMGNFRHQSIRTGDRGGDKDSDRERERDLRDKEGQERLRNLSDKYDPHQPDLDRLKGQLVAKAETLRRGRLAKVAKIGGEERNPRELAVMTGATTVEEIVTIAKGLVRECASLLSRDGIPHPPDATVKTGIGLANVVAKGTAMTIARTKTRTITLVVIEMTTFVVDREDYDRDRDDNYRGDVRDRYDYSRRPRDLEWEDEDQRRWRDDGRRDERMAARRGWDRYDDRDRERPTAPEDRETRAKRGTGRDRKVEVEMTRVKNGTTEERGTKRRRQSPPGWRPMFQPHLAQEFLEDKVLMANWMVFKRGRRE